MFRELRVRVPEELYARFTAKRPPYLTDTAFLCLMLDKGLTDPPHEPETLDTVSRARPSLDEQGLIELGAAVSSQSESPDSAAAVLSSDCSSSSQNKEEHQSENKRCRNANSVAKPEPEAQAEGCFSPAQKRASYTPDFQAFWERYRKAPEVVPCSKWKAFLQWKKAIKGTPSDQIIHSIDEVVRNQRLLVSSGQFCPPLPDAFRWLRDRRYEDVAEGFSAPATDLHDVSW